MFRNCKIAIKVPPCFFTSKATLILISVALLILLQLSSLVKGGKEPFGFVGSDLGDYRLQTGEPFVTLYEHENYRGKLFRQRVRKECSNIPWQYINWSSSILLHGRCVTVCDSRNCEGGCQNLYPNEKGVKRLSTVGLNDKARSVRFCYQQFSPSSSKVLWTPRRSKDERGSG